MRPHPLPFISVMSLPRLNEMAYEIHATAVEKGWWDEDRSVGEILALIHSEISEALEEYRNGAALDHIYTTSGGKPEGFAVEIADCVIRCLDLLVAIGVDPAEVIIDKMTYNHTRPHRHGDKLA